MGATGGMMAASTAAQGANSLAGAYTQSQALKAQGAYQKQTYEMNAQIAGLQADDAITRGNKAARITETQTKGAVGDERASMAAQGIALDSGSALDVQTNTATLGALDAMTIRNNAMREAWGYKLQANSNTAQGNYSGLAANNAARNTLLTGGLKAVNSGFMADYYAKGGGMRGSN